MRKILLWFMGLLICGLVAMATRAETYQLTDGTSVTGTIIVVDENGLKVRQEDGSYSSYVPWLMFSQDALKKLLGNPKAAPYVDSLIDESVQEAPKKPAPIQPVTRLERPAKQSLFGAMLSSSVGLMVVLLLYGANIYAGYEIAIFRAQPPALVCGVAAIAPLIGPIVFLVMPTRINESQQTVAPEVVAAHEQKFNVAEGEPAAEGQPPSGLHIAQVGYTAAGGGIPAPQIFSRGEFTFNRRFIETKFAGYFGVVRVGGDRDMVLTFKTARGEFIVQRIARITGSELHLQVHQGMEVMVPFTEIKEIQLRHKDS